MAAVEPKVSIIVPIYNVEPYLEQCLESIAGQALEEIEVICVVDGSPDSCLAIANSFAEEDSRFQVINKENTGYGDSVNTGIRAANGQYLGIVEPDDWVATQMYSELWTAAEKHGFPDVVKGDYWRVTLSDSGEEVYEHSFHHDYVQPVDSLFTVEESADLLFLHPSIWSAIYKRSFLEEKQVAFLPIPGAGWADNPFLMDSLVAAESIVYIDEPVYYYREYIGSSTTVDPQMIVDRWLDMDDIIRRRGISSRKVLEAHYSRGCWSVKTLAENYSGSTVASDGILTIMGKLDGRAIIQSKKINAENKKAYLMQLPLKERLKLQFAARV